MEVVSQKQGSKDLIALVHVKVGGGVWVELEIPSSPLFFSYSPKAAPALFMFSRTQLSASSSSVPSAYHSPECEMGCLGFPSVENRGGALNGLCWAAEAGYAFLATTACDFVQRLLSESGSPHLLGAKGRMQAI